MLIVSFILINLLYQVKGTESQKKYNNVTSGNFLSNVHVLPFLDNNDYIRLNISWGKVEGGPKEVSFIFGTEGECSPISEVLNYMLKDNQYIIIPSMELQHPADILLQRCHYEIVIEDNVFDNHTNQTFFYTIPECVKDKCACKNSSDSPYKIKHILPSEDDIYTIEWDILGKHNLTIHQIRYQNENSNTTAYIAEPDITLIHHGVKIPIKDISKGVTYNVTVMFTDVYDACNYFDTFSFYEANNKIAATISVVLTASILIVLVYIIYVRRIQLKLRLYGIKRRLLGIPSVSRSDEETTAHTVLHTNVKEEINFQYTPYEFLKNRDKYDKFEVPRNKVILEEEIGSGAFGTVYKGKVYHLDIPKFKTVAIKLLRENAPQDETVDFLNEINLFKKIGDHENIIQLVACVTINQPYMMIMELVSQDSLKMYLLKLRRQWDQQKNIGVFFPDDGDGDAFVKHDSKNSDCQYFEPDNIFDETETHNQTESLLTKSRFKREDSLELKYVKPIIVPSPKSPRSITSSRLPSSTGTETTIVDLQTPTLMEAECQPSPILSHKVLHKFAFEIASGMEYLEKNNITHRDLAARNVLMGDDKTLKISDFGLSRLGPYVTSKSKKLPLRWMAIEAIENRKCDSKCDVWSFGVVLWEIGTLGAFPYEGVRDDMVLYNLKTGVRLKRPEICTSELYQLMMKCWQEQPSQRPTFEDIKTQLDMSKSKAYADFSALNRSYVFPPVENR